MTSSTIPQPVAMRRTGVRAPRIHRDVTLVRRRPGTAPQQGNWSCGCEYYQAHRFCAHTLQMASAAGRLG
jgi:hypothetical protein